VTDSAPPTSNPSADSAATRLPSALAVVSRFVQLGPNRVPALLAHPDWVTPAPTVIWIHGRTVSKELDNGRYLRWMRAGIATCAIDLPGHGERFDRAMQDPANTLLVIAQAVSEIDGVVAALGHPQWGGAFDLARLALGGMSAGGMTSLRRLCDPHPFVCASVEGTGGNLGMLYGDLARPGAITHPPAAIAAIDPMAHLGTFRPIPLLALHSELDQIVPIRCIRSFIESLRAKYGPALVHAPIELRTWPETGAPMEHNGFGRVANDAKLAQLEFLQRYLSPVVPATK